MRRLILASLFVVTGCVEADSQTPATNDTALGNTTTPLTTDSTPQTGSTVTDPPVVTDVDYEIQGYFYSSYGYSVQLELTLDRANEQISLSNGNTAEVSAAAWDVLLAVEEDFAPALLTTTTTLSYSCSDCGAYTLYYTVDDEPTVQEVDWTFGTTPVGVAAAGELLYDWFRALAVCESNGDLTVVGDCEPEPAFP